MEIVLIRHTKPDIEKGICYGQSDIDLADSFQQEINTIKEKISDYKKYKIYSSPLKRCKKLASSLFSTTIHFDDRLKELDFGNWELKAWDNISSNEMKPWMNDFVNKRVPNGESYVDLQKRTLAFIHEKIKSQEDIVVVTHAGVIRALKAYFDKIKLKDSFKIRVDYGDIFTITV